MPTLVAHVHIGSIGSITSAAAVAASSFDMNVTNPREYLDKIDLKRFEGLLSKPRLVEVMASPSVAYVEPAEAQKSTVEEPDAMAEEEASEPDAPRAPAVELIGKIQRLGDFIDTDAVRPMIRALAAVMLTRLLARSRTISCHLQEQRRVRRALHGICPAQIPRESFQWLQCRRCWQSIRMWVFTRRGSHVTYRYVETVPTETVRAMKVAIH